MKTQLQTTPCHNPYQIGNGKANNIIFYNDDGVIAQTNRGWIGSNRIDILELKELDFNRRIKLNLNKKEHFYIKSDDQPSWEQYIQYDVYIYIPLSGISIKPLGEQKDFSTKNDIHYGNFYELTATFNDGYDFSKDTHETRRFMEGYYTRIELTERGDTLKSIKELTGLGISEAEALIENKSKLIKLLKAA